MSDPSLGGGVCYYFYVLVEVSVYVSGEHAFGVKYTKNERQRWMFFFFL